MAELKGYIDLRGFTELTAMLRGIAEKRQAKLFKAAIHAGAVEMARSIRDKAPGRSSGALKKSIKARQMPTMDDSKARSIVEVNNFTGKFLERGWRTVRTNRYFPAAKKRLKAATPGPKKLKRSELRARRLSIVSPKPFVRPGFQAGIQRVSYKIQLQLGKALIREFKKLGRY